MLNPALKLEICLKINEPILPTRWRLCMSSFGRFQFLGTNNNSLFLFSYIIIFKGKETTTVSNLKAPNNTYTTCNRVGDSESCTTWYQFSSLTYTWHLDRNEKLKPASSQIIKLTFYESWHIHIYIGIKQGLLISSSEK